MKIQTFLYALFLTFIISSSFVNAETAAKPTSSSDKIEIQNLKKQVQGLNTTVAKLLGLVKALKKEIAGLKKRPAKNLANVGRILGVYYKQWWWAHEKLSPPRYLKTRTPYINNWLPTSNRLIVNKKSNTSHLKVIYNDNLRVLKPGGGATACIYSVFIDGMPCAIPSQIDGAILNSNSNTSNPLRQRSIIGICSAKGWTKTTRIPLKKGRYEIRIYVRTAPGYSGAECYSGWYSSTLLMIEEIEKNK